MVSSKKPLFVVVAGCAFTSMASMRVCDAMLPQLAQEFHLSTGEASSVIWGFALAYGVSQLVYGPLGDHYGKLRMIAFATLACALSNAWSAASSSFEWLLVARCVAGATAAGIIPLAMAWIGDTVAYEARQVVLAKLLGATVFGMMSGQWLGAVAADALGWRWALALLAMVFGVAAVALFKAGGHRCTPAARPSQGGRHVYCAVLQRPWARVVLLVTAMEGAFAFSALAFIPSYLQLRFGLTASAAGLLVVFYGIGGLIFSRVAGGLVRRCQAAGLAKVGGLCAGLAFMAMAVTPSWYAIPVACLCAGFGFYALHNTLQVNATQMAPAHRATAVAMFACSLFLGQSLGVAAASWLIEQSTPSLVFGVAGLGLLMLGFLFSGAMRQRGPYAA
ncbi:MFS transporter [Lampropedia aestuarii]|uniref:MFS transporter n=1 Tax=Lampropedia aestuarii TaxID=2562762 RepID=UPI00246952A4|nr:MFS transporter [Lampropedia aestuarii]MDH5855773.1 MFS transporter [Lampropedia aestuarii]